MADLRVLTKRFMNTSIKALKNFKDNFPIEFKFEVCLGKFFVHLQINW